MNLPEILTISEVAKYLRVNYHTVYRLIKSGRLPAFKVGRAWRFHRADIERYVTYKYQIFGPEGTRPSFYHIRVLQKYLKNKKKYYIRDEAFSGTLGLKTLYQDWKQGKISGKEALVEMHYQKVRVNTAQPGEPVRWELLVVISPQEHEKIISVPEEQNHWSQFLAHRPPPPV